MTPKAAGAIDWVMSHEGGWSDNPADPGGATNYGISLRWLKAAGWDVDQDGDIDAADIAALTPDGARRIYHAEFWERLNLERVTSGLVARKVLDLFVNMGDRQAVLIIQRAAKAVGAPLDEDGIWGPLTLGSLNSYPSSELLAAIRSEAAGFYRLLAAIRPALAVFLRGWLTRAYS